MAEILLIRFLSEVIAKKPNWTLCPGRTIRRSNYSGRAIPREQNHSHSLSSKWRHAKIVSVPERVKTTGAPQARCARLVSRAGAPRCPLFARRPSPRTCLPSAPPGIPPGSFPRSILRRSKSAAGTGWPSVGRLRISRQRTARNTFHRSSAPSSPHTDPTATQVFHDHGGQSNKFLSKVGRLGRVAFSRRLNNGVSLPAAKHAALDTLPRHFIS